MFIWNKYVLIYNTIVLVKWRVNNQFEFLANRVKFALYHQLKKSINVLKGF